MPISTFDIYDCHIFIPEVQQPGRGLYIHNILRPALVDSRISSAISCSFERCFMIVATLFIGPNFFHLAVTVYCVCHMNWFGTSASVAKCSQNRCLLICLGWEAQLAAFIPAPHVCVTTRAQSCWREKEVRERIWGRQKGEYKEKGNEKDEGRRNENDKKGKKKRKAKRMTEGRREEMRDKRRKKKKEIS